MKRKALFTLSILLLIIVPKITNAAVYTTTVITNDNDMYSGVQRTFAKGNHQMEISFDSWNSSICKSDQDTSKLTVNWYSHSIGRTVASVTTNTHLYTCSKLDFGTQRAGIYLPIFLTFDTNQNMYCGFKSDYIMLTDNQ